MKIRDGFVSNSSSSSFVIVKSYLTSEQVDFVKNYVEEVEKCNEDLSCKEFVSWWYMDEKKHQIKFTTSMNNFDLISFFEDNEIPSDAIEILE